MDVVDRDEVGRMEFDFAAVKTEMDPIDGLREVAAEFQTGIDVEIEVESETTEVLA